MDKRFGEEEIIADSRKSDASYYLWRGKFGGVDVSEVKRLKALEAENAKRKKLPAASLPETEVIRELLRKGVAAYIVILLNIIYIMRHMVRRSLLRWLRGKLGLL